MQRVKSILLLILSLPFFTGCDNAIESITPTDKNVTIQIQDSLIDLHIEKSYIFRSGLNGYQYGYADIIRLADNTLILACARNKAIGDFLPAKIITSISSDNGETWSNPQQIENQFADSDYINIDHPSLLNLENGHIMLFFLVKYSTSRIDIRYKESFDNGKTWGADKVVYAENQGYQILNNARVIYANNRIFVPISIPEDKNKSLIDINALCVFYYYSDDQGVSWQKSVTLRNDISLLEPNITPLSNNELLMNIRTNIGKVLFARSIDGGATWSFENSMIKSPSSPQKIARIPGTDSLIMVWNNTDINYAQCGGNRNPLSLAISTDKGYTWKILGNIEQSVNSSPDYSYPSIFIDKQFIYITYYDTSGGSSLKMARIPRSL